MLFQFCYFDAKYIVCLSFLGITENKLCITSKCSLMIVSHILKFQSNVTSGTLCYSFDYYHKFQFQCATVLGYIRIS